MVQVQQASMPRPASKPVKPLRTAVTLAVCALAVCGVGLAAVFVAKSASKVAGLAGRSSSSPLAGLASPGSDGSEMLAAQSNQQVMAALSSGNAEQALAAMAASGTAPSPVMETASAPQTPTLQSSGQAAPSTMAVGQNMPDDVRRWLEHLQKIEQARIQLAAGQLQEAVKTLVGLQAGDINHAMDEEGDDSKAAEEKKQNSRAQKVGGDMQSMTQAWRTLLTAFDSVPAPAECVGVKANYDQVVGQTGAMILDIVKQIRAASDNPQGAMSALTAMQGTSKSKIDVPARAADQGVSSICKRYDTVKWFDIQGDVGNGAMSQLGF